METMLSACFDNILMFFDVILMFFDVILRWV